MNKQYIEEKVYEFYKKLLKKDEFGFDVPFGDLGGQSIMAAKLQYEILREFKLKISYKDLYENDTVNKLSSLIEKLLDNDN